MCGVDDLVNEILSSQNLNQVSLSIVVKVGFNLINQENNLITTSVPAREERVERHKLSKSVTSFRDVLILPAK